MSINKFVDRTDIDYNRVVDVKRRDRLGLPLNPKGKVLGCHRHRVLSSLFTSAMVIPILTLFYQHFSILKPLTGLFLFLVNVLALWPVALVLAHNFVYVISITNYQMIWITTLHV